MSRRNLLVLLLIAAPGCSSGGNKDKDNDDGPEAVVVDFDGLKSAVPKSWEEEEVTSPLRKHVFRLPGNEGDDAELVIYMDIGGSAKENVERWKTQFIPPAGKKIEDVSRVEPLKIKGASGMYLDVSGTYLDGRPGTPDEQKTRRDNYRMLAVHFQAPKKVYHIKLTGPAATVEKHKKAFDDWLNAFK